MDRWRGKVALVTGASSGIGRAVSESLARNGMKVVGCSPETTLLAKVAQQVNVDASGEMVGVTCDISNEVEVLRMFETIEKRYGCLHVCVNCAGLAHDAPLASGTAGAWNSMLSVNVIGLSICTREAVQMMQRHGVDDGHIIQICSMSGIRVPPEPLFHFYSGTKHAVKALSEGLRNELRAQKSHIRVTCLSPGDLRSRFLYATFADDPAKADTMYARFEHLEPEDVADAVVYAMSAPARVDVNAMQVLPTEQSG